MFDPLRECVCGEFILPLDRHYGYFLFTIAGSFYNVPLQKDELGRAIFEFNLLEQIPSRAVCLLTPAARPIGPAARALAATLTI